MSSKKKVVAIAITTVALTAGSFGVANAAKSSVKTTKVSATTVATQAATGKLGRGQQLADLLKALVTKGTITQAQADAIVAAQTAADAARPDFGPMGGPNDGINIPFEQKLTTISSVLGIDSTTVTTRLKAGESLATIAGTKKAALITALVADETKRIDAAVTAGTITAAQATTLKADLTAHVTAEVEGTLPGGGMGRGMGPKGGHGHGGPRDGGMGAGGNSGAPQIPSATATPTA